jgi:hypothetical protein
MERLTKDTTLVKPCSGEVDVGLLANRAGLGFEGWDME